MMRYIPTDKYTVAWFKLAECVAKGEKEKAFGVYRLLMHSLEDKAYAYQLEGDLLGAFQDERAFEKYEYAAQLYVSNHRWKEAAALYQELACLGPDTDRYIKQLLQVCKKYKTGLNYYIKLTEVAQFCLTKNKVSSLLLILDEFPHQCEQEGLVRSFCHLCLVLMPHKNVPAEIKEKYVDKAVEYLSAFTASPLLMQFLSSLEQSERQWYNRAHDMIHRHQS